jgi:tRNA U34 5-methylaminomethyl-2-thiouridine-forming methyltransferase MnmC
MQNPDLRIDYTGLEPYPLDQSLLEQLSFENIDREMFRQLHQAGECGTSFLSGRFNCRVLPFALKDYSEAGKYNLILYDAFAPSVQPELWSFEAMQQVASMMFPGAVWVSYCAKGEVRRNLQSAGLKVGRLAGPPFKRHMLRAVKP